MEAFNPKSVAAFAWGRSIVMAPTSPASYVERLIHEVGHVLANELSFKRGFVLTPEQTRQQTIPLTRIERSWLLGTEFRRTTPMVKEETLLGTCIVAKLIEAFSEGNFDLTKVEILYGVNVEEFLGSFKGKFSADERLQRDIEVPAFYAQIGCLNLLRESLATLEVPLPFGQPKAPEAPSHRRAFRIAERAYERNWILPSMLDRAA